VTRAAIVIFTDDPGWHGRVLTNSFQSRGYACACLSLADTGLDLQEGSGRIVLPEIDDQPAGVFVRGVPGGSLEQVILRLDILHLLTRQGTLVYNHPLAIERTVDKAMTTALLRMAGIPTPPTWVAESPERLRALAGDTLRRGGQLVVKPLFGSQGQGVQLVDRLEQIDEICAASGVAYLQERINTQGPEWSDIRVLVIDGTARAAMRRRSAFWVTNRAQGACCEPVPPEGEIKTMAEDATRIVDIDYAGIDLIIDQDGQLQVLEVNSIPAWKGLQEVCVSSIADMLVDDFITKLERSTAAGGGPATAA
jgi:tetrahydromethanopterin:alpha-L-glutamate ligase